MGGEERRGLKAEGRMGRGGEGGQEGKDTLRENNKTPTKRAIAHETMHCDQALESGWE